MEKISVDIENETKKEIQKIADELFEGNFGMAARKIIARGLKE